MIYKSLTKKKLLEKVRSITSIHQNITLQPKYYKMKLSFVVFKTFLDYNSNKKTQIHSQVRT